MTTEKIYYTDGHHVTITDSNFQVNNNLYRLDGIIQHAFAVIRPNRVPVIILLTLGVVFLTLGIFDVIPARFIGELEFMSLIVTTRILSIFFGSLLIVAAAIVLAAVKEKYAIQIVTAEGEKEVIVSKRREYVALIVEALNRAFMNVVRVKQPKVVRMARG